MENAEASVRMEGYEVTPEMREQCERILRGEATLADCLRSLSRAAQSALHTWPQAMHEARSWLH